MTIIFQSSTRDLVFVPQNSNDRANIVMLESDLIAAGVECEVVTSENERSLSIPLLSQHVALIGNN